MRLYPHFILSISVLCTQHHSGTHYLGVWGAKVRQQILKYTLTDCFTLTSQMRIVKSVWSFADRDLLLFSLGTVISLFCLLDLNAFEHGSDVRTALSNHIIPKISGDRFRRLNVNDEKRTKIVARILRHVFSQLKIQPRFCGHDLIVSHHPWIGYESDNVHLQIKHI